ncbi:MAG: M50 family metallopeptidase [Litorimonas sp.]
MRSDPDSPNDKSAPARLPPTQFWGLAVVIYMVLQMPYVRVPFLFISTWAHEFGHGLGALAMGGEFIQLTVFPNFSGVAQTATSGGFARAMVVVFGLLGPSALGVLMIGLTRGLGRYRTALIGLSALLFLTLVWAADLFTVATIFGSGVLVGLLGWKGSDRVVFYAAQVLSIAICLTALTGFGYFFMGNAEVAGALYRTDTGILADIWGGAH